MEPILILNEEAPVMKERDINIHKDEVYKDVDRATFKYTETSVPELHQKDAVSSDTNERLDRAIVERKLSLRDAKLRVLLQRHLRSGRTTVASNTIEDRDVLQYHLLLREEFNDNLLQPVAEFIHQYLVYGILFDWYSDMGMAQAASYGTQLSSIENEIKSLLFGPSIVKRPMQPFGPAKPTIPMM